LRIVQCTPLFLPSEGGTQKAVLSLSKELIKQGHDVSVFTYNALSNDYAMTGMSSGCELKSHEKIDGIDVYRFRYSSLSSTGLRFSASLSWSLFRFLARREADIVHFHGFFHLPHIVLSSFFGKVTRTPLILTTHGLQETLFDLYRARNPFLRILATKALEAVLASVDGFVALSQKDVSALRNLGLKQSKIYCVPNGVDTLQFKRQEPSKRVLRKYGFPSSGRVVLCVGRVSRNKGLHYLILAASELKKEIDDLFILIVGPSSDISYKNSLTNLAGSTGTSDIVHFADNVPDDDLVSLYSRADLFVLPSEQETLPLVVLEAMASGCPVIATSVGGIPEIITSRKNGLLVKPSNVEGIIQGIRMLLNDDNLRRRIGEQGRKTAGEYSWDKIARRVLAVYSKCLSKRRDQSL
jgi:glycosyltransferase involved in cell wall biosynthesis